MIRLSIVTASLLLLAAAPASAATMQCDVVVQSQSGGEVEMRSSPQPEGAPRTVLPTVIWRPAPSNSRVAFWVAYHPDTLTELNEPYGVLIEYALAAKAAAPSSAVIVRDQKGRVWRFTGKAAENKTDDVADVEFGTEFPYGRALLGAIADGQPLTMSVERDGLVVSTTQFGSGAIRARDLLLAEARKKFQAADPMFCANR
jgi:hypothetical protein